MKRSQLQRMIYDSLKPEMPELVLCHDLICVTPVNSMLRGVAVTPLIRSRGKVRVSTFARPLFCPDAGFLGDFSWVTWGLFRRHVWSLDELEDPHRFQRLLRVTRRKVRRLSLVDTPERYARNSLWVFGRRFNGWDWLRVGLSYAHAERYDKAARILRRKVLTWEANPEVRAKIPSRATPILEPIQAGDYEHMHELLTEWQETAIGEFRAEGVNLNAIF